MKCLAFSSTGCRGVIPMMLQTCNRRAEQYFMYKAITIRLYVPWLRDIVRMMDAVFGVAMRLFSKCPRGVQIARRSTAQRVTFESEEEYLITDFDTSEE